MPAIGREIGRLLAAYIARTARRLGAIVERAGDGYEVRAAGRLTLWTPDVFAAALDAADPTPLERRLARLARPPDARELAAAREALLRAREDAARLVADAEVYLAHERRAHRRAYRRGGGSRTRVRVRHALALANSARAEAAEMIAAARRALERMRRAERNRAAWVRVLHAVEIWRYEPTVDRWHRIGWRTLASSERADLSIAHTIAAARADAEADRLQQYPIAYAAWFVTVLPPA